MRIRRWIIVLVLVVLAVAVIPLLGGPRVEPGSVLLFDVQGQYAEVNEPPLMARLTGRGGRPLAALLSEFAKAERDERLAAVVIRIRSLEVGWGKAQEIRDAIARLREAGKRTIAYIEVESYGANLEYYVATAAEHVYFAPGTRSPFLGLAAEYFFLGGLWEKLGVSIEVERVGEYKSATDTLTAEKMSSAHREMANALLDSMEEQFVTGIAERRGLTPTQVRNSVDAAPATPAEMKDHGLVDGILFLDEILSAEDLDDGRPLLHEEDYAQVDAASVGFDPQAQVALIYGSGNVVTGEGSTDPRGSPVLASETVSEALESAAEDPEIQAIILRVDSPGGSALASDLVWRATRKVQEKGKPIVASFSDVAASGGYYVACGADSIVAEPASLTGSIGVFVLRPVVGGLLEKLGIGVESLTRGEHAGLLLGTEPLALETRARLRADVEGVYALFVERVAAGRGLPAEAVDAVGRGRVFTGAQAWERKLVDHLGGLHEAVRQVKVGLGLDPEEDVALVPYPPPRPFLERLAEATRGVAAGLVSDSLPLPRGMRQVVDWIAGLPTGVPLLVPPYVVEIH